MAVVAGFSIRGYAASMRGGAAAEGRRLFGVEDLPPMDATRFRWWADELAAAAAVAEPPPPPPSPSRSPSPQPKPSRRTLGKARAPKKRSISDLFAAAPPFALPRAADSGGGNEAEDDEALCAIMRRTREQKRKRRLEEAAAAAAAAEARESEGNFPRKETHDEIHLPGGLDTPQASKKPGSVHHARTSEERCPDLKRRKKVKITSLEKKNNNKIDKKRNSESRRATKVGKQHDLKKMLPLHSILKKYTKHTSVKMVKEKHGDTKGTEVIEVCRKSVKRVKFSEVNDVLGINKQSICKLFSDALASSSSSSTDMSSEGDKNIAAESSSSHMPEKAFSKEASKNTDHEGSLELTSTELSSNLIDLNEALPESTDLNYPYVSDSEVQNPEPTQLDSDVQVIHEGRQNRQDLSFDSHGLECQALPESSLGRARNSISSGTFLRSELMEVSDTDIVGPSLKLTGDLAESHGDCSSGSVKDATAKGQSTCVLPTRTVQDSLQQHQKCYSFNLNLDDIQLSSEGEFPLCQPRECNASSRVGSSVHSGMGVQQECRPSAGQTVRLMGKDLAVSTTRGEYLAEMAQEQTHSYTEGHSTKLFLELPREGRPYLSLQAQSFPNVPANSASSSQSHIRYTAPHNSSQPFSTANALSGDRFSYLSDSRPHGNVLLGSPSRTNHGSTALHQNTSSLWLRYSDLSSRTASPSAPILPTTAQHVSPPSSVYHGNLPRSYGVISAGSSMHPHISAGFTFTHPVQMAEEASDSRRGAALPSRNAESVTARASIPDISNSSSGGRYVQRTGPMKLTPGAKHILMPSETTGDGTSMPVYSRVSFGSRRGNVSATQNMGAELYKL
ncbi:uncharacterized protein LOC102705569 isoform X1 [Oryza brachyantha]|uniref:uncharacterized protein LOC102705569 isoform X1 n=1 Tax=Oryza brachyantha TaxID=4533 RepID=UPI001ADC569A|nr:uncharacterized protein LOC102705569 isoform X1 [Oryza brachyantha]